LSGRRTATETRFGQQARPAQLSAHAVLYLAADESAMMTSHTFTIDGGLSS